MKLFKAKSKKLPTTPTKYPEGTFVKTEKGFFYIAGADKRYSIISERILNSWAPNRVVNTTEAAVREYRIVAKMKFRNGSLIHNIADGRIYLIVKTKRRHVTSPDVLTRLGATGKHVISVSLDEIKLHEEGEPLK